MIKLVLDTNALISAIGWKESKPRMIFDSCINGRYSLIESVDLLKEFTKVIQRPKFSFISETDKKDFLVSLMEISTIVEPKDKVNIVKDDPDDNIVLECALEGKADYIISGYDHLKELKKFKNTKIVSPDEFLNTVC